MSDQTYQPTLIQLRAFVAIAKFRHFGAAATTLGISQPTLSQSLSALETGLGVQLVERSTRRVLITEAGQALLDQAEAIVEAASRFVAAAAGVSGELRGSVRFGMIPTVAPYILPRVLPMMHAELPGLRPMIVEDQTAHLLDALRLGVLDIAVIALPAGSPGMVELELISEDFVLVVPDGNDLADCDDLTVAQLADLPLLLLDEGHCLREQTLDICRRASNAPVELGDTRAASLATAVQCVAGGMGVTLIPEMAVQAEVRSRRLAVARFADPIPGRTLGLVYRQSSPKADAYEAIAQLLKRAMSVERLTV